jgi:RNA polymerase sigma factor (sigma-70 family)
VSILRRRISDHLRQRPVLAPPYAEEAASEGGPSDAERELETRELAELVGRALGSLSQLERAAVVLCDLQERDRDEVSAELGVTRVHLRVLLHRARHKLDVARQAEPGRLK